MKFQLQRNIHRADRCGVFDHRGQNQVGWTCPAPLKHISHHLQLQPLAIAQAESEMVEGRGIHCVDQGVARHGLGY